MVEGAINGGPEAWNPLSEWRFSPDIGSGNTRSCLVGLFTSAPIQQVPPYLAPQLWGASRWPGDQEIAVLSLLIGNFPEKLTPVAIRGEPKTVAEVIGEETKNIREARRRLKDRAG